MMNNLLKSGLIYLIIGLIILSVSTEMIKTCTQIGQHCLNSADCCTKQCLHGRYLGMSYCISLRQKSIPSTLAVKNYTACLQNHRSCSFRSECCSKICFKIPGNLKGICVR